ncbi:acyl-CoA dehydrogenase family protein [Pseudomonas typographi]|uniref:acyl-CoA dehydrogenase family protein n=1 Tax=Pseudomonas typographi TaxID=2715964 RepID=UPI001686A20F|nr:acyl-CoA dehydrogenase family protein [Pseudomonas typographi]MBD1553130.1 hypothetical protein [Pseudomonas typographi]MBD1585883.1 hypothetical protein [Pseudomonas typographi]
MSDSTPHQRDFFDQHTDLLARVKEQAADRDRTGESPRELIAELKRRGFTALRLAHEHGGQGYSVQELIRSVITLASADSSVAHVLRSHFGFADSVLLSKTLSAKWLGHIARGETFAPAISEKTSPRPMDVRSALQPVDGGYRLSALKSYTTGALHADWVYVSGLDEAGVARMATVPAERDGITMLDDFDGIGQRASSSGSVRLNDLRLGRSELEVELSYNDPPITYRSTFGQLYLLALLAGIAQAALDDATTYVLGRARPAQHGHASTPREDVLVQSRIGQIASLVALARSGALEAARQMDRAHSAIRHGEAELVSLLERTAVFVASVHAAVSAVVLDATNQVFGVGSGSAITRGQNLDRHWRNARTVSNHSPIDYKYQVVGDNLLNSVAPPQTGYF